MPLPIRFESVYSCDHIGVAGTTKVHVRQVQQARPTKGGRPTIRDVFEARVGIALMGATANPETNEDSDPFSMRFRDNFARGYGTTEEEALEAMKADMHNIANGLWAV
jgi:hypothetical protein